MGEVSVVAVSSGAGGHPLCLDGRRQRRQCARRVRPRRSGGCRGARSAGLRCVRSCGGLRRGHGGFSGVPRGNSHCRLPHPPASSPDARHGEREDQLASRRSRLRGWVRALGTARRAGAVPPLPRYLLLQLRPQDVRALRADRADSHCDPDDHRGAFLSRVHRAGREPDLV